VRAAAPHARARVRSDEEVRRDSHAEFAEVIVFSKNEAICITRNKNHNDDTMSCLYH
jgi:hypothetical protein